LEFSEGDDKPKLRPYAEHLRPEAADAVAGAAVTAYVLVGIPDNADLHLFANELRSAPVKVQVDAVLILSIWILEVIGETKNA